MTPSSEDDYATAAGNNEEVELIQNISKLSGKFSSLQNSFVCLHLARPSGPSHHLGAPKASRPPHLKRPPGAEDLEWMFLLPLQHLWTIDNHSLRKASYEQSARRKSDNLPQFLALNVSGTFEPWGWQKDGSDHFRSSAKEKKALLTSRDSRAAQFQLEWLHSQHHIKEQQQQEEDLGWNSSSCCKASKTRTWFW